MMRLRVLVVVVGLAGFAVLLIAQAGAASRPVSVQERPAGFLTGPASGRSLQLALRYLGSHTKALGLTPADLAGAAVVRRYTDKRTGMTHIALEQRYRGIPVFHGILTVSIARDGSVINVGNRFVAGLAARVNATTPSRRAAQGVVDAARGLGLALRSPLRLLHGPGRVERTSLFGKSGISLRPIPARLVYAAAARGVRLAWNVTVYQTGGEHLWNANVDAKTGALLSKVDEVSHESYRAVSPPFEDPLDAGGRSLLVDPANPVASPFGWLDTNGVAGADSTLTIGNNVHAALDLNKDGVPDPGSEPDGGQSHVFDFPLDLPQDPFTLQPAAVTNLFFWTNYLHDLSYHYGFTEQAGNFQDNNHGRGGVGGDSLLALDQYGGFAGDNAQMGTPPDGESPVMTVQLWSVSNEPVVVTVNAPAQVKGSYAAGRGDFGVGTVTGDVAVPGGSLGCVADDFTGFPSGKIALVDRGTCTFSTKVRTAQAAGATALIVVNNAAGAPIHMPSDGQFPRPPIPAAMISQSDGATFKANLAGLNATVSGVGPDPYDRDASLDSTIMAHEYTHGITTRLTGDGSGCLLNEETGAEGWSDFVALAVTAKAGQTRETERLISSYSSYGVGIRTHPYTTDMSVNPLTYDSIKQAPGFSGPEFHYTGEVWASMLWEVYWNLVDRYGFDPNLFDDYTAGGNTLALQLVFDGLKLQPCDPGFVDARDAILVADRNDTGGANQCLLWQAFAKRGLGEHAQQGSSESGTDGTEDFTFPAAACAPPDTTPPEVTIATDPSDSRALSGWYNIASSGTNGVKVNVSASDPSGVSSLRCTDGTGHALIDASGSPQQTTLAGSFVLRDGEHAISCQSMDASNNLMFGSANAFFSVDQTGPVAFFQAHPASYTVDQTVSLACVSSDGGSGLATACTSVNSPAYSFPVGVAVTVRREASDNAGNTSIATTTITVTDTPAGLSKLTQQLVRSSPKYQTLTTAQKATVEALLTIASNALKLITPQSTAQQKAAQENLYIAAVNQLAAQGYLTPAQASTLTTLARKL